MVEPTWVATVDAFEKALLVLFGAFVGFGLTGLQAFLDRRRRRISMSSALLIELRVLEHALSLRYDDKQAALAGGRLNTPVFDKFSSDFLLLTHDQLYHVLHFYGFVADVNQHLLNAKDRLARHLDLDESAHNYVRLKSQFALATIARAKAALEDAGGILPVRSPDHGKRFKDLPPAPPKSFDNYPVGDG